MSLIQMQPVTGPKAWRGDEMAKDPSWSIPLPATWLAPSVTSSIRLSSEAPAPPGHVQNGPGNVARTVSGVGIPSPATIVAAIWIGGALIELTVLVVALLRLRRLAARSERVSTGTWRTTADEICTQYGIHQPVRLLNDGRSGGHDSGGRRDVRQLPRHG